MKTKLLLLLTLVMLALISTLNLQLSTCVASPLGTAFTYQGKLADGGNPAQGIYDLRFAIYDAGEGGSAVTGILTNAPVAVTNGLFTTLLDFGSDVFVGEARWLEMAVRTNGAGGFTILSPRQILRPIPYALFAMNANLTGTYSDVVAFTNLGNIFNGEGGGLDNLNAARITAGTLNDARLSTNVALLNNNTNRFLGKMIVNNALIVISNLTSKGNITADGDPLSGKGRIFAAGDITAGGNISAGTNISASTAQINTFLGNPVFNGGSLTMQHSFSTNGPSLWTIQNNMIEVWENGSLVGLTNLLEFIGGSGLIQMQLVDGEAGGVVARKFTGDGSGLTNVPSAIPRMLVFTNDGNFIVPEGVTRVIVEVWGGGGGGGSGISYPDGSGSGGNSGGGGAYGRQVCDVTPGTNYPVTVGLGGGGDADGGTSSFGSLIQATGGGAGRSDNFPSHQGLGGTSTAIVSRDGEVPTNWRIGGASGFGGRGGQLLQNNSVLPGVAPGGGGGGAWIASPGNPGAAGRVIVYY